MCFYLCDVKMCVFCKKRKRNAAKVLKCRSEHAAGIVLCHENQRQKRRCGGVCAEKAVSPFIGVFACLAAAMFLCKKISFSKSVTFLFYAHDFCAPKDRFLPGFYPANVKIRASKP